MSGYDSVPGISGMHYANRLKALEAVLRAHSEAIIRLLKPGDSTLGNEPVKTSRMEAAQKTLATLGCTTGTKTTSVAGSKALIFDVNDDDYECYQTVSPDHIRALKLIRARRIRQAYIRACKKYLDTEENGMIKRMMMERDFYGKLLFKSHNEIVVWLIGELMRYHEVSNVSPMAGK